MLVCNSAKFVDSDISFDVEESYSGKRTGNIGRRSMTITLPFNEFARSVRALRSRHYSQNAVSVLHAFASVAIPPEILGISYEDMKRRFPRMVEIDALECRTMPNFENDSDGAKRNAFIQETLMQAANDVRLVDLVPYGVSHDRPVQEHKKTVDRIRAMISPVLPEAIEDKGAYRVIHMHAPHQDNMIYSFMPRDALVRIVGTFVRPPDQGYDI